MEDLLIKYVTGEATPQEVAEVERWLREDGANRQKFEQYKTLWEMGRRMSRTTGEPADARQAWRQVAGRLGQPSKPNEQVIMKRRAMPRWIRVAAAMTGFLILSGTGYILLKNRRPDSRPGETAVEQKGSARTDAEITPTLQSTAIRMPLVHWRAVAGRRPVRDTLPDGTVVTLNRGTSLAITGGTVEKGLIVRLHGEGFFEVPHHSTRSFVVEVGEAAITVLGTSFEVNEQRDSTELVVETGAVRVDDSVIVHSGEQLTISGRVAWNKTEIHDPMYGYYLGRPLICDNTPLRKLVEVLNRTDGTRIVLGRPELGDLPLTTEFQGKSPDRILEIVALTFRLSIVRQGPTIILK